MNAGTYKTQENKNQSLSSESKRKSDGSGGASVLLEDNRPQSIQLQEIRTTANNHPKKNVFQFVNNRPKSTAQLKLDGLNNNTLDQKQPIQKKENKTGLPENLKSGIENLSGYTMDDVKVHYNSEKPAQLQAHAYAQGTDIHVASGQEKHLPHEAWHVVQQNAGRVKPTKQLKSKVAINDDISLEKEADLMGAKAIQMQTSINHTKGEKSTNHLNSSYPVQRAEKVIQRIEINKENVHEDVWKVFKEIGSEAKLLFRLDNSFTGFFELSSEEQIKFLHALDSSTLVVNTIIQRQAGALMGPQPSQIPPLQVLQAQFLQLNPQFLQNLFEVTQGRNGTFRLSQQNIIHISSFQALRSTSPSAALLGDKEQQVSKSLVKFSQISIQSVMAEPNLARFIQLQNMFQAALRSMDDLRSVGYEFEFASFTDHTGVYSENELIPSHQLMAVSAVAGNYFGLSWRLESDSKNTLELVSPPFVFSKDQLGAAKSETVKNQLREQANSVKTSVQHENGTLPTAAGALEQRGIGFNWIVNPNYENYRVIGNRKSGGDVYSQQNVSMYPQEIGALLEGKFSNFLENPAMSAAAATYPTNVARLVRQEFLSKLPHGIDAPPISDAVRQAIAVFSRYASNVLAIPTLRHRQDTGIRKDNLATEVKETLDVWVKTDALNLLKPILENQQDKAAFITALGLARPEILSIFTRAGNRFIELATPPVVQPPMQEVLSIWNRLTPLEQGNLGGLLKAVPVIREQIINARNQGQNPAAAVTGYVQEMQTDVTAFINRVLNLDQHEEANPQSTTREFLEETFGTGEGVRKGTYIKGVKTAKGPMYVTELR